MSSFYDWALKTQLEEKALAYGVTGSAFLDAQGSDGLGVLQTIFDPLRQNPRLRTKPAPCKLHSVTFRPSNSGCQIRQRRVVTGCSTGRNSATLVRLPQTKRSLRVF